MGMWDNVTGRAANARSRDLEDLLRRMQEESRRAANASPPEDRSFCERVCREARRVGWRVKIERGGLADYLVTWRTAQGRIFATASATSKRVALYRACAVAAPVFAKRRARA